MKKRNYFKFTRPGLALEIAVFAVVLFMIMGLCLLSISSNGRVFAIRQGSAITARAACDAGITKAIQLLKNEYAKNPTTYNSNPSSLCSDPNITGQNVANETFTLSTPAASYSYTVSYDSTNKWYQIDCTGTAGPWRKTAHARVIPRPYNVFFGMGLGKTLTAKNNDKFLSYPASAGSLLIKTNSTATGAIDLSKSTIEGDVAVGDGGDPSKVITNPSSVTGKTYASADIVYPPITAPNGPAGPALNNGSCTITAAPPSGKAYQYSTISASGNVTINPNLGDVAIYVSGSMKISNITVGKGSTLLLYIGQSLTGTNNVAITNNNLDTNNYNNPDPAHVLIFGTAGVTSVQNITLKNNADVYACIYAPNADIQLKNNGNVYGTIVANSFTFKNNATFGYDTACGNFDALTLTNFGFAPNYLEVLSWWE
jgi:hypothetical protein